MYIGNTNTRRLHSPGCRAVGMIKESHRVVTDSGEGFNVKCKWCGCGGSSRKDASRQSRMEEYMENGIRNCNHPKFYDLFRKVGCFGSCDGKGVTGSILMFPDPTGVEVPGEEGRWWVFMECDDCGYQTAWWKCEQRLKAMNQKDEAKHVFRTEKIVGEI